MRYPERAIRSGVSSGFSCRASALWSGFSLSPAPIFPAACGAFGVGEIILDSTLALSLVGRWLSMSVVMEKRSRTVSPVRCRLEG